MESPIPFFNNYEKLNSYGPSLVYPRLIYCKYLPAPYLRFDQGNSAAQRNAIEQPRMRRPSREDFSDPSSVQGFARTQEH